MSGTTRSPPRLLVIQVAGLGHAMLAARGLTAWRGLAFRPVEPPFPGLTCPVQATFRTGLAPAGHGIVGNGFRVRELGRPLFWEQSAALVAGARIWDRYRAAGGRVGLLFWQQSLGEQADVVLSPAPIHKHHGGTLESLYSQPPELGAELARGVGRRFRLRDYWGPLASDKASDWIAETTATLLARRDRAPDLCLTYLPALDYDLQRHGPTSTQAWKALDRLFRELGLLLDAATRHGYEVLVFGDYAIGAVAYPVYPNRVLREAGLFAVREVGRRRYPDLYASRAWAVVDHEVAHVYVARPEDLAPAAEVLAATPGVERVHDRAAQRELCVAHERGGELMLVAAAGAWFAYPWWHAEREAPDYAAHVDIHSKPGYDPCELFAGWPPGTVGRDALRVRGSHGRIGPDRQAAWAATCDLGAPATLAGLAQAVGRWLTKES
jgi:predicted AlkP superfamily pyrophosphatase or phosphodiesterase